MPARVGRLDAERRGAPVPPVAPPNSLEVGQHPRHVGLRLGVRRDAAVLLHRAGTGVVGGDRLRVVAAEPVELLAQVLGAAAQALQRVERIGHAEAARRCRASAASAPARPARETAFGSKPDSALRDRLDQRRRHAGLVGGLLDHVVVRRRRRRARCRRRTSCGRCRRSRAARRASAPNCVDVGRWAAAAGASAAICAWIAETRASASVTLTRPPARAGRAPSRARGARLDHVGELALLVPQPGRAVLLAAALLELAHALQRLPGLDQVVARGVDAERRVPQLDDGRLEPEPGRVAVAIGLQQQRRGPPRVRPARPARRGGAAARSRPPPGRARAWRYGRRAPSWRPSAGPPAGRGRCRV